MAGIVIHIGQSKTGTTTLQRAVFENHAQLYYLGKIYQSEHQRLCVSSDTFDFLASLLWRTDEPWDAGAAQRFFADIPYPARRVRNRHFLAMDPSRPATATPSCRTSATQTARPC